MFDRFTENARRVVLFARFEAEGFGSQVIEAEHLLLGILSADKDLFDRANPGLSAEIIRSGVEERIPPIRKTATHTDLSLSNSSKRILAYAVDEAKRLAHAYVGTEHILLALLREETCLAARLLNEFGFRLHPLRQRLAKVTIEGQ
jgi:ATP-dependent Clp protease ATP-binding subunit ClpC